MFGERLDEELLLGRALSAAEQARQKIDELHKNYLALAASTKAGNVVKVKESIDPSTLRLSRSEM